MRGQLKKPLDRRSELNGKPFNVLVKSGAQGYFISERLASTQSATKDNLNAPLKMLSLMIKLPRSADDKWIECAHFDIVMLVPKSFP